MLYTPIIESIIEGRDNVNFSDVIFKRYTFFILLTLKVKNKLSRIN